MGLASSNPFSYHLPPLVTTNLISFSMNLFIFELQLAYNTLLVPGAQYSDWVFLYTTK